MRWKWQLLKLSSMWLFTIGSTAAAVVCIGLGNDWQLLGSNDWLLLSAFATWALLLVFVHYLYVHSSKQLLQKASQTFSFRNQPFLVALVLNLPVLVGWIFAGFLIVLAFTEAEPGTHPATIVQVAASLLLLSVAIAVGNYLLAINAYFELQHMRRKQQEDILHAIGNQYIQKLP